MRKVVSVLLAGVIAVAGLVLAAPSADAAPVVGQVSVCVTVTPKTISVSVNDITIGETVAQPTTCVFL